VNEPPSFPNLLLAFKSHWRTLAKVAALSVVAMFLLYKAAIYFGGLDSSVKAPVIGGTFALLAALAAYVRENKLKRQEAHRSKKIEIYMVFFDMIIKATRESKDGGDVSFAKSPGFINEMFELKKNLMFYGSPPVLNAFNDFQNNSKNDDSGIHTIDRVGELLLAMRKDIGLSNFGLDARGVLQTIVRDDIKTVASKGTISP
jgi:hypothetical protein